MSKMQMKHMLCSLLLDIDYPKTMKDRTKWLK